SVTVTLQSGEDYDAQIVGGDEDYDVAVLKIEGEFTPVVVGDSSSVKIGESIAAIGNPLGELTFSMSQGIVSCTDRAINVDGTPFNMIQIDASINPGNSGGPLVNTYGEVIGIVSAKYTSYSSTTVEGIGFAIPMNDVIALIEDIMTNGYNTNKAYLGITPGTMTEQMAAQYRYEVDEGVFVYSVEEGSAAEKAGLKMGDVILKVDDHEVDSYEELVAVKKKYSAGDTVTLTVYRGETVELSLTFDAAPADTMEPEEQPQQQPPQSYPNYPNGGYYNPWDFFNNFFGYGW
ncbi:MAG: trypsin-like peptidase domain-containing protein, partial [Oscillospiraceae bacterium]|nr:trypsin-like peptidase domain-containing protein [Oscillospiraceae bacterium]